MRRVCVFCGSRSGNRPDYVEGTRALAAALVERDLEVVYGGGRVGLMGELADATLALGGGVIGVIPQALRTKELAHEGLTELRVVASMHERKATMAEAADAFVALPGGFGTLEEFCEVLTWSQLGLHGKPCGLLDVAGYWRPLLEVFDSAVREGFVARAQRELVLLDADPARLLAALEAFRPRPVTRWMGLDQA
jgi:uncharacterized protein (TIGR00730 family)